MSTVGPTTTASATRALYLRSGEEPVFAMLDSPPPRAPRRATAALLCPPLGWQDVSSYRARRQWAHGLAAAGYPTLRLDLPGSGDSAGGPRDAALVDRWVGALRCAAETLLELHGVTSVVALGFGLGGLVLCRALAEGAPIEDVVLWGVNARGRPHIREQRAFARLEQTQRRGPADADVPEGALLTAGFLLSAETLAGLEALDLSAPMSSLALRRALLLERDGIAVDTALHAALVSTGAHVETAPGEGFADMFAAEPHEARSAGDVLTRVLAWLSDRAPDSEVAARREPLSVSESAAFAVAGGGSVRETPLHVDAGDGGRLFGVLTEPPADTAGFSLVLLNAGAQRHIGVNRMWVEIARRWAARGVPTLRLDLEAIGDADGESCRFRDIGSFYVPEFVRQVSTVLDELVARGLPDRFALLGLCSGAYWSFQTALADDRVVTALMLNPRVLVWDDAHRELYEDTGSRRMRRNATSLRAWWRLMTSPPMQRRAARRLASLAAGAVHVRAWVRTSRRTREARDAISHELADQLDRLRDRGQRGLLLFTAEEPLCEELQRDGHLDRRDRWPNLEVVSDRRLREGTADNHTLRPLWLQQLVHERLDEALGAEVARHPSDTG